MHTTKEMNFTKLNFHTNEQHIVDQNPKLSVPIVMNILNGKSQIIAVPSRKLYHYDQE